MIGLGVVAVFDATYARLASGDPFRYLYRQGAWAGVALLALHAGMSIPYSFWRRVWLLAPAVAVALLVTVMLVGPEINGAKRWLVIAGPIRFQPSEFAKLAVVIFLASHSALMRSHIQRFWKGFVPATLVLGVITALVAKEDLGTGITILLTGMLLIFVAGAKISHLLALGVTGAGACFYAVWIAEYRKDRILAWLDPQSYLDGAGYQVWQGLLTLGSGQLTGKGFTQGVGKHLYLPAAHNDYIYAVIGEEFGLVGAITILALFMLLIIRGLSIGHRTKDWFGNLLAIGLVSGVGIQALLNMAVVTASLPATGLPLPFISYGGSSLVMTTLALGIVLNISQQPLEATQNGSNVRERSREVRTHRWGNRRAYLSGS